MTAAFGTALAVWLGFTLIAVTGLGIYAVLYWKLAADAPWPVRLVYRVGQAMLVWTVFVLLVGLTTATVYGLRMAVMGR